MAVRFHSVTVNAFGRSGGSVLSMYVQCVFFVWLFFVLLCFCHNCRLDLRHSRRIAYIKPWSVTIIVINNT